MANIIQIIVSLVTSAVTTGLGKLRNQFRNLRKDLNSELGSWFAFAGLTAGLKSVIDKADNIQDLADKFGVGAEALQRYGNAASTAGGSMEDVAMGMNKLLINQQKALEGDQKMLDSFEDLKISATDLQTLGLEELFDRVANGVATATDRNVAYSAVVNTLGKSAHNLFATFEMGSDQIRQVGDDMGIMSDKTVASLDNVADSLKKLKGEISAFVGTSLTTLANEWKKVVSDITFGTQMLAEMTLHPTQAGSIFKEFRKAAKDMREDIDKGTELGQEKAERRRAMDADDLETEEELRAKKRKRRGDDEVVQMSTLGKIGGGGGAFLSRRDPNVERAAKAAEKTARATEQAVKRLDALIEKTDARWNP